MKDTFISIGSDAVRRMSGARFECSPLSCNQMAPEYPVNEHCLIDDLDTAVAMARAFAVGKPEPGPYCADLWLSAILLLSCGNTLPRASV